MILYFVMLYFYYLIDWLHDKYITSYQSEVNEKCIDIDEGINKNRKNVN